MTTESIAWFAAQFVAAACAALFGRWLAKKGTSEWRTGAVLATLCMLGWPLLRFFPTYVRLLIGTRIIVFTEVMGIIVPASLLFGIAARRLSTSRERRGASLLLVVTALYGVKSGFWMLMPPVPNLGETLMVDGVCSQTTEYTCVAASLVTLLHAYGIPATETEMARLSYTEIDGGTTDIRALLALERKIDGRPLRAEYERMDLVQLRAAPKPVMVPIEWGYFISHMVPVLEVTDDQVLVGDPLGGPRWMPLGEFQAKWFKRGIYVKSLVDNAETKESTDESG